MHRTSTIWKLSDAEFQQLLDKSDSFAHIVRQLRLSVLGGSQINNVKKRILIGRFDTSQLDANRTAAAKDKSKIAKLKNTLPLSKIMVENSTYACNSLKRRLIKEKMLQNCCKLCGIKGQWNGQALSLQLDHINGVNNDHRLENLRLLCPNCHSQTATYCGNRNRSRRPCKKCDNIVENSRQLCDTCLNIHRQEFVGSPAKRKCEHPDKETLFTLLWHIPTTAIGHKYGVSDKAVEKWAKNYGLKKPPRGYWQKTNLCKRNSIGQSLTLPM